MGKALRSAARVAFVVLACLSASVHGAQYDYDQLGRLVRSIDSQGRVTEYVYDAAGNLLQVVNGGAAQAPTVASFTPGAIRRNQALPAQISGTGLAGTSVASDDPNISLSAVAVTPTAISFGLLVFKDAGLGTHTLTLRNAAGTASVSFQVQEAVEYAITPVPIAIPPDGSARVYTITTSTPDSQALSLAVTSLNTAVARPGTASVSIPTGATQATGSVIGVAEGVTALRLSSPILIEPIEFRVGVSSEFAAGLVARARLIGLVKGNPASPGVSTASTVILSPVGIVKGNPTIPGSNTLAITAPLAVGIVKGDPSAPGVNTPASSFAPAVGVSKN